MIPLKDVIPSRTTPGVTDRPDRRSTSWSSCSSCTPGTARTARPSSSPSAWCRPYFSVLNDVHVDVRARRVRALRRATCCILWIFGDNVEDRLGHGRFLVFYLAAGVVAALAQAAHGPGSRDPDGRRQRRHRRGDGRLPRALSALARADAVPVSDHVFEVPAIFFLGLWFLIQFLSGLNRWPAPRAPRCRAAWRSGPT